MNLLNCYRIVTFVPQDHVESAVYVMETRETRSSVREGALC